MTGRPSSVRVVGLRPVAVLQSFHHCRSCTDDDDEDDEDDEDVCRHRRHRIITRIAVPMVVVDGVRSFQDGHNGGAMVYTMIYRCYNMAVDEPGTPMTVCRRSTGRLAGIKLMPTTAA